VWEKRRARNTDLLVGLRHAALLRGNVRSALHERGGYANGNHRELQPDLLRGRRIELSRRLPD
jgi:hypothetical protein